MKIAIRGTFDLYLERHEDYLSVKWTGLFLEAIKTLNRVDKATFSPIFFFLPSPFFPAFQSDEKFGQLSLPFLQFL